MMVMSGNETRELAIGNVLCTLKCGSNLGTSFGRILKVENQKQKVNRLKKKKRRMNDRTNIFELNKQTFPNPASTTLYSRI